MNLSDVLRLRLSNQQISSHKFTKPGELVAWMGALQAQDYPSAKWALGLRLPDSTDGAIEQALSKGEVLRTHVMRPTWHFVAPADIRWMLALTAPKVKAQMAYYSKRAGLDGDIFKRSQAIFLKTLAGGKQLTRAELGAVLEKQGITLKSNQMLHILAHAELDAVICSGAKRGKQLTWALLDERVPPAGGLNREEAVAELTQRYFASHGPATVKVFAWWSGLSTAEIKKGLESLKPQIMSDVVEGQSYWFYPAGEAPPKSRGDTYLLPPFDEYMVGYTDRLGLINPKLAEKLKGPEVSLLIPTLIVNGQIIGTWKRPMVKKILGIEVKEFEPFAPGVMNYVKIQAARYGKFMGLPVKLIFK